MTRTEFTKQEKKRVLELFEKFHDLDEIEQTASISQLPDDQSVIDKLVKMLAVNKSNPTMFDLPLSARVRNLNPRHLKKMLGKTLGDFTLTELMHEGIFSAVFKARQTNPIVRDAIIKLIHSDTPSDYVEHFFQEQKALAALSHPNIVKIIAVEKLSTNETCSVVEFIDGLTLNEYCVFHRLTLKRRLNLFVEICDAIAYCHEHKIVHLDIKPPNILVRKINAKDVPTVIDFGISSSLKVSDDFDSRGKEHQNSTHSHSAMGTPQFMSPEHLVGDLDERADVYSLGILLFSIIFDDVPFDWETFLSMENHARREMIAQFSLSPPSEYFQTLSEAKKAALVDGLNLNSSIPSKPLDIELDWIFSKATSKDRKDRYQSVYALAEDIRLFLSGMPPKAAPKNSVYLFDNFLSRHRKSVSYLFAVCAISLIFFLGLDHLNMQLEHQVDQTSVQQRVANDKQQNSELVSRLANEFITLRDPYSSDNHNLTNLEEIIEAGVLKKLGPFDSNLETRQGMVLTLAESYSFSRYPEKSWQIIDMALRNVAEDDVVFQVRASVIAADAAYFIGHIPEAETYATKAYQLASEHSSNQLLLSKAARSLGAVHSSKGDHEPAVELINTSLNIARSTENFPRLELAKILYAKTRAHVFFRERPQAIEAIDEALTITQELLDFDHPILLTHLHQYAMLLSFTDSSRAVDIMEDTYAKLRVRLGEDHPKVIGRANGLALVYARAGQRLRAIDTLLAVRSKLKQVQGENSPQFAANTGNLAALYSRTGQPQKALEYAQRHLELITKYYAGDNQKRLHSLTRLVEAFIAVEDWVVAREHAEMHFDLSHLLARGNVSDSMRVSYELLYEIALSTQNYDQAREYAESYSEVIQELKPNKKDYLLMARAMKIYPELKGSVGYAGEMADEMALIYDTSLKLNLKTNQHLNLVNEWMQDDSELVSLLNFE